MADKKVVRLADLEAPAGEVLLPSGRTVSVRPIDGRGMQIQQAMQEGKATPADAWKLAALILPDATEEELLSLSLVAIGIVAQIACGALNEVLLLAEAAEKLKASSPAAPQSKAVNG